MHDITVLDVSGLCDRAIDLAGWRSMQLEDATGRIVDIVLGYRKTPHERGLQAQN